jgi:hypothetical protein
MRNTAFISPGPLAHPHGSEDRHLFLVSHGSNTPVVFRGVLFGLGFELAVVLTAFASFLAYHDVLRR